ncbi:hypothetical protein ANN_02477 [Periplaneta americana]|uniref:Uncharacterized protein n=1 Tax=Periplaneta americana TaxID=6978 RepID=A0ABQ8TY14_PERAM|nr:hypothetical protein ANN_02477 [Periplaneta americana]
MLRKIFGAKRDEVTGEWRKLRNTELHALYSSPDIIRNLKSRRLRWAGHVARMGESRNAYRLLVGRPEGKRPLGRPRRRWEDNIKMDLRKVGYDDRDWINLAQDRDRWRAYVTAAMNLRLELIDLQCDLRAKDRLNNTTSLNIELILSVLTMDINVSFKAKTLKEESIRCCELNIHDVTKDPVINGEKFPPAPGIEPGTPVLRMDALNTELRRGSIHSTRSNLSPLVLFLSMFPEEDGRVSHRKSTVVAEGFSESNSESSGPGSLYRRPPEAADYLDRPPWNVVQRCWMVSATGTRDGPTRGRSFASIVSKARKQQSNSPG